ncbi:hemolysin family protein [Demequina sp. SYSU T00039]|uniref:Hemolysin family protein n=1 Tax=Demequina lignilytica TaxID=3051663 RepID=A0AAW7M4R0_9MICO|nr:MULTISPECIES: hemolysin family protein [unclassified Demequina]MDN4478304.1 hemolysin family protein [Demequina sp. SYSU T00039-1]MDN4489104.1 hemolysin family protein [Demequina sp. SYSU T00039]
MTAWILIGVGVLLTLGTAVFVAAEFSLVALDPAHVDDEKDRRVRRALSRLSTQLSGAQVGITLTTILLGFTAQPALVELLEVPLSTSTVTRAASGALAGALAVILVNAFSMLFGELVPKNMALAAPLRTARVAAPLNMGFTVALRPLIAALNSAANGILRLIGIEPKEELAGGRSRQELAALVRRSAEAGTLAPSTALLLKNSIELDDLAAIDVMTDRTRLHVLPRDAVAADVLAAARATGHSRFPVVGDGHDDVLGLVHLRAAIAVPAHERAARPVRELMVEAPRIPETMQMGPLLVELRGLGPQCAIVVDEYGGTAGLVTLEDVVEELVGEVADEHDRRRASVHRVPGGAWIVPGDLRPDEVRERTGLVVPESPAYETVGGFIMAALGRVAAVGDIVDHDGVHLRVERMDGRRIDRVRLAPIAEPEGEG